MSDYHPPMCSVCLVSNATCMSVIWKQAAARKLTGGRLSVHHFGSCYPICRCHWPMHWPIILQMSKSISGAVVFVVVVYGLSPEPLPTIDQTQRRRKSCILFQCLDQTEVTLVIVNAASEYNKIWTCFSMVYSSNEWLCRLFLCTSNTNAWSQKSGMTFFDTM